VIASRRLLFGFFFPLAMRKKEGLDALSPLRFSFPTSFEVGEGGALPLLLFLPFFPGHG